MDEPTAPEPKNREDVTPTVYPGVAEADAAALVLRYQQGEHEALACLHEALRPAILACLRRYRAIDTLSGDDLGN